MPNANYRKPFKFDDSKVSYEVVNRPSSLKRRQNESPYIKNKLRASALKQTSKKYESLDSEMRKILEEDEELNSSSKKHLGSSKKSNRKYDSLRSSSVSKLKTQNRVSSIEVRAAKKSDKSSIHDFKSGYGSPRSLGHKSLSKHS